MQDIIIFSNRNIIEKVFDAIVFTLQKGMFRNNNASKPCICLHCAQNIGKLILDIPFEISATSKIYKLRLQRELRIL